MSWLSKWLHPEEGYQKAQEQLDNYYNQAQGFLSPYMGHGEQAFGPMFSSMNALLNPEALHGNWVSGYEQSPSATNAINLAKEHGLNAASAMGLMGSRPALDALQSGASQISLNDRQNYLNSLMQKYMQGTGLAQNIYGIGANAAGQMGHNAMNMGDESANMAYAQNNAQGDLFGRLLGGAAGLAGSALGGPIGGALGAGLSQTMGWSSPQSYDPSNRGWSTGGY